MLKIERLFQDAGKDAALLYLLNDLKLKITNCEYNDKEYIHIDYNIFSDRHSDIAKECRGVVIDAETLKVVRFGFYRFFNLGESGCDAIDWNSAIEYEEKCDGSLIFFNYIQGLGWNVGTRGKFIANVNMDLHEHTFSDIFWKYFPIKQEDCDSVFDKEYQYLFELCAPENRIVVKYDKPSIYLIGMRNIDTWSEVGQDALNIVAEEINVNRPKSFKFDSLSLALKYLETLNNFEGYVVRQWNNVQERYYRAKIKHDDYKALHNIITQRSLNNLVKLVIGNKINVLKQGGFQQYLHSYDAILARMHQYFYEAENVWMHNEFILDECLEEKEKSKKFALAVKDSEYGSYCFAKKKDASIDPMAFYTNSGCLGKKALKEFIIKLNIHNIVGPGWLIIEDEDIDI